MYADSRLAAVVAAVLATLGVVLFTHSASAQLFSSTSASSAPSLDIVNMSSYTDSDGKSTILGLVRNNQMNSVDNIQVYVTLYDKTGAVMASNNDRLYDYILKPGQYSGFAISFDAAVAKGWDHFKVTATFDPKPDPDITVLELKQGKAFIDSHGYFHLAGELTNHGNNTIQFAQINGAFFDSNKRLTVVEFANSGLSNIAPGQTLPFEFVVYDQHGKEIRYSLLNALSYDANRYMTKDDTQGLTSPNLEQVDLIANATISNNSVNSGARSFGGLFSQNSIQGHYKDNNTGLEIDFPNGWSGIKFGNFVMVTPSGFNFSKGPPEVEIGVLSMNTTALSQNGLPIADSTVITTSSLHQCNTVTITSINAVSALHASSYCNTTLDDRKSDAYMISNKNGTVIGIVFVANNSGLYDRYIGDFQSSVRTMKLSDSQDIKTTYESSMHLKTVRQTVKVKDKEQDLAIESSSNVTDFKFSENEKTISFRVSGVSGTSGNTIIHVGSVMQGPFTVTMDGKSANFSTIADESTGDTLLLIQYHHSAHDIVVTGTDVVPEFPLPMLGLLGGITAAILIARKRLSRT